MRDITTERNYYLWNNESESFKIIVLEPWIHGKVTRIGYNVKIKLRHTGHLVSILDFQTKLPDEVYEICTKILICITNKKKE